MKGKMLVIGIVLIAIVVTNANFYNKPVKVDVNNDICKIAKAMPAIPIKMDARAKPFDAGKYASNFAGVDIQVTSNEFNDEHPSICIIYDGNPFVLYDAEMMMETLDKNIVIQKSPDGGNTWEDPENMWVFEIPDTMETHPEISVTEGGYRAFGTYEVEPPEANLYFLDFVDLADYTTWTAYYFDLSDRSTYVLDTTITTYGTSTIAIACVSDFTYGEYDLDDTLHVLWNTEGGEGTWSGLFLINQDSEGNTFPVSRISAASGERMLIVYQMERYGDENVYVISAPGDDPVFENWRISRVSTGYGNATNPVVAASGKYYYIVMQNDAAGNEDIVCYTSTNAFFWQKRVIANSPDDEIFPSITADGEKAICTFIKNGELYMCKTEDGGNTWSEPEKVNDVDGTVVGDYGSVDINGPFIIWTDNRNGNNDLYLDTTAAPVISIDVSGGFGIKLTISNTGTAEATDLPWSISVDGFILLGKEKSGTIATLPPGQSTTVNLIPIGIGPATITATAGSVQDTVSAFIIGPIVILT